MATKMTDSDIKKLIVERIRKAAEANTNALFAQHKVRAQMLAVLTGLPKLKHDKSISYVTSGGYAHDVTQAEYIDLILKPVLEAYVKEEVGLITERLVTLKN